MRNSKITNGGTLSIFDIDDTLFHTTAKVAVVKDNAVVRQLSNKEFNSYTLGEGERFDYSEFRNAHKFHSESVPILPMMQIARHRLLLAKQCARSKVIMVTARANFDIKETFLDTFRKHQFDIDSVRVERAGNISDIDSIALKKVIIIRNYIKAGQFKHVAFYDDAQSNLTAFLKLKEEFPTVAFDAYLASECGARLLTA